MSTDEVARVAELEAGGVRVAVELRTQPGDGFDRAGDLYDALLDDRVAESAGGGATDLLHVGAQWWFERCAWLAASVALGFALTCGRVPRLAPGEVLVAHAGGIPTALGVGRERGTTLGGELEAHLAPLTAALGARRLRAATPLWRSAGDRLVQAALWAGAATGDRDSALALAEKAMAGAPFAVPVRTAVRDGMEVQMRRSCCLAHRTPSALVCVNCPREHGLDRQPAV